MKSTIYEVSALFFLLALVISIPALAQDDLSLPSFDPNAAGTSSPDGYTINVGLPQGVVYDVIITDTLPQGLIYQSGSLQVSGAAATLPEETVSSPNDGSQPVTIIWSFGQVNNTAGEGLILSFQPIVANVASNQNGVTLAPNQVTLQYKDGSDTVQTASAESDSVKLVEPDLDIELIASPAEGNAAAYTAYVYHSSKSDADAFDTDISIALPSGVVYSPGSARVLAGPMDSTVDASSGALKWHLGAIDRSWNWNSAQKVLIGFNATTESRDGPGEIKATLTWKSAPGDGLATRSYVKSQSLQAVGYAPDYAISVSQIADPNPVQAGQILLYTISYTNNGQDDVHGVTISDSFDSNVTFLSSIPLADSGRNDLWTIGDLLPGETGTIKIMVEVNPSSPDGTLLRNVVNMACIEQANSQDIAETLVKGHPENKTEAKNETLLVARTNSTTLTDMGNNSENATLQNETKIEVPALIEANETSLEEMNNNSANITIISHSNVNHSNEETITLAVMDIDSPSAGNMTEDNATAEREPHEMEPLEMLSLLGENISSTQEVDSIGNDADLAQETQKNYSAVLENIELLSLSAIQPPNNDILVPEKQVAQSELRTIIEDSSAQLESNPENNATTESEIQVVSTPASPDAESAESNTLAQLDELETSSIITLQFGNDITVDLELQKDHLLDDFVVTNSSNSISNTPEVGSQLSVIASEAQSATNQSNESSTVPSSVAMNNSGLAEALDQPAIQTNQSDNSGDMPSVLQIPIETVDSLLAVVSNETSNNENVATNQPASPVSVPDVIQVESPVAMSAAEQPNPIPISTENEGSAPINSIATS